MITESLAVDASCVGNPGIVEYQGVFVETKKIAFRRRAGFGTNNLGEFLAIVHGLAYLSQNNLSIPIYSDSQTAIIWVNKKAYASTLDPESGGEILSLCDRAVKWLRSNRHGIKVLKWETKRWGEIPADFGRKK
ncbi:MAG: RNase H family protein [Alphaproteobacteria bacterium]